MLVYRPLRKWVSGKQFQQPTFQGAGASANRPLSHLAYFDASHSGSHGNTGKSVKDLDNIANANRQYREKQKLRQQQYFSQGNQNEYQEFIQFKDSKTRAREAWDRKQREKGDGDKRSQGQGQIYGSPNYKSDKKMQQQQYHILVSQC